MKKIRKITSILLGGCIALAMISSALVPNALAAAQVNSIEIDIEDPLPLANLELERNIEPRDLKIKIKGDGGDDGAVGTFQYIKLDQRFEQYFQVVVFKKDKVTVMEIDATEQFTFPSGSDQTDIVILGVQIKKIFETDKIGFTSLQPNGGRILAGKVQFKTLSPSEESSEERELWVQIPPYEAGDEQECENDDDCGDDEKCVSNKCVPKQTPTGACAENCNSIPKCLEACKMGEKNLCLKVCRTYLSDTELGTCESACGTFSSSPIEDVGGVEGLITSVARWISIMISVIAVIFIILGGFGYITAGGDEDKAGSAKTKIMYGLIGLAVAALAWGAEALVRSALNMGN